MDTPRIGYPGGWGMRLTRFERATHILAPMPEIAQYYFRSPPKVYRSPVTAEISPLTGKTVLSIDYFVLGIDKLILAVQWSRAVTSPVHESTNMYLNATE